MLRATQRAGQSGDLKAGLPTPIPRSVWGFLLRALELREYPQPAWWPRHHRMHVETDINHMTTLSSVGRRHGKEEHQGGVCAWLSCLKTKPLPS